MSSQPLVLKSGAERRLLRGHLWIYSNEVDSKQSPLGEFNAGDVVPVLRHNGKPVGLAMVNPHTLICGRLVSRDAGTSVDGGWLRAAIQRALTIRERVYEAPYYRLVHAEGDGLPGLVIDRFGDVLVLQLNTAGIARLQTILVQVLEELLQPAGILLRNDAPAREIEGLPKTVELLAGAVPEGVPLLENGVRFIARPHSGQKTGWYYDHRHNRDWLKPFVKGARVLDVFSYTGAWGVQAAAAGATQVLCVDNSEEALTGVVEHAGLNGVADRVGTVKGKALDVLKSLLDDGERFDVVVLDPPAFIKRRKDQRAGEQAYFQHNELAVQLLAPGGVLVSASCSMHMQRGQLNEMLGIIARRQSRSLSLLWQGGQGPDHPVHPAITETDYLKALFYTA